jgi:hypothetical protein
MKHLRLVPVFGAFLAIGALASAQEEVKITKKQPAYVLMESGAEYQGILHYLDSKKVEFQRLPKDQAAIPYNAEKVLKVKLQDGNVYDYDKAAKGYKLVVAMPAAEKKPALEPPKVKPEGKDSPPEGGSVRVEVRGEGLSQKEAEDDAIVRAMEKVVGAYVEAETRIENDKIIKDKVLRFTGGEIKSKTLLKAEKKDGVVEVLMSVDVIPDTLRQRLRENKVPLRDLPPDAFRKAFGDKTEGAAPGKRVVNTIDELLDELYSRPLWKAEYVGNQNKPDIKNIDANTAKITVRIRLMADLEQWEIFRSRLEAALDKARGDRPPAAYKSIQILGSVEPSAMADSGDFNALTGFKDLKAWYANHGNPVGKPAVFVAVLRRWDVNGAEGKKRALATSWAIYCVPKADADDLKKCMESKFRAQVRIALLDADGEVVKSDVRSLEAASHVKDGPGQRGHSMLVKVPLGKQIAEGQVFLVTPFQWWPAQRTHAFAAAPLPYEVEFEVTEQESKRIRKIGVTVENVK